MILLLERLTNVRPVDELLSDIRKSLRFKLDCGFTLIHESMVEVERYVDPNRDGGLFVLLHRPERDAMVAMLEGAVR